MTEDGQQELLKKVEERNTKPKERDASQNRLCMFDYTEDSKRAMLSSAGTSEYDDDGESIEVELCADTGACDTVMPRKLCGKIQIQPSMQSINGMEYEVADVLGERRCLTWTDGASKARPISLQAADVHKALLSLSRCAGMGFESRFGRVAGALIDEETEEVKTLKRKGDLYVLKCWLRAAPFARQESR